MYLKEYIFKIIQIIKETMLMSLLNIPNISQKLLRDIVLIVGSTFTYLQCFHSPPPPDHPNALIPFNPFKKQNDE